jgi:zinc transport system permease protein
MAMADVGLLDLLGFTFFQRALLGGSIAAIACAAVGVIILLRKEAMIGHGIAHVSFGGVAVGEYLVIHQVFFGDPDTFPLITALAVSVAATLSITYLRRRGIAESDAAIALITALGFAVGLIVISLAGGFRVDLFGYLFGNVLTISGADLALSAVLGAVIISFLVVFHKEMLSITFDEEAARLSGLPVRGLTVAFDILVALTIVLAIKIIGIILVSALLALPAVTALQLRLSFRQTMVAAALFSIASVVLGIALSAIYDVATSGLIVVVSVLLLAFVALYVRLGDEREEGHQESRGALGPPSGRDNPE